jgi:hypothetical protein
MYCLVVPEHCAPVELPEGDDLQKAAQAAEAYSKDASPVHLMHFSPGQKDGTCLGVARDGVCRLTAKGRSVQAGPPKDMRMTSASHAVQVKRRPGETEAEALARADDWTRRVNAGESLKDLLGGA